MRTLKLYFAGGSSGNALASIVIPSNTKLRQIQYAWYFDSITDNADCTLELSRASASEIAVNGAQQCVAQVTSGNNFVTSGLSSSAVNGFIPVNIPMVQGQILYLHALVVGTIAFFGCFVVHYE